MRKIRFCLALVLLMCSGCVFIQYNDCNEAVPPENADTDIKRLFKRCSSSTGVRLHDKSRLYYAAYAEGHDAEHRARQIATEKIRRSIVGKRYITIPLYGLKLFKHFLYDNHYWGIYFITRKEYDVLRQKYYKR